MNGEASFEKAVKDIHDIPFLLFLEIFGIFIPLLFHSIYGVIISAEAKPNVFTYNYGRNWFYFLQRATGIFLFLFIFFHILNLRFGLIPGLESYGMPVAGNADLAYDIVAREFSVPWVLVLYILGIAATAWHLAYGVWLFAGVIGASHYRRKRSENSTLRCWHSPSVFCRRNERRFSCIRPCGYAAVLCEQPKAQHNNSKKVDRSYGPNG